MQDPGGNNHGKRGSSATFKQAKSEQTKQADRSDIPPSPSHYLFYALMSLLGAISHTDLASPNPFHIQVPAIDPPSYQDDESETPLRYVTVLPMSCVVYHRGRAAFQLNPYSREHAYLTGHSRSPSARRVLVGRSLGKQGKPVPLPVPNAQYIPPFQDIATLMGRTLKEVTVTLTLRERCPALWLPAYSLPEEICPSW